MIENIMISVIVLLYGLVIGSFLNVCIYRIPIGRSVIGGRSYCPHCNTLIPWYLNIPVFSYLFLRGRCKNCQGPISPVYPAVELLNGILYLIVWFTYGLNLESVFVAILLSVLVVVAFIDWQKKVIPDKLVIFVLGLSVLHGVYQSVCLGAAWYTWVIGFFAASLPLFLLSLFFPDGLGGGDIKLMAAAGFFMGPPVLLALFLGSLYASITAVLLITVKKRSLKSEISFGPFLSLGIFTVMIFGEQIFLSTVSV
ncbi:MULTISPECIES: A24 family peptidase [unclassified Dehalobacter]|uniref:prepilin peptidase n=1 Tax=unclassified Dehalobacter TaxID=2635733 RepID=UPI000370F512|nr:MULTISPECIES: A24 family peptidase [unclassified Dehalobacter]TCX51895.1 prepilin peptidase [Dehalobacter sp. 14DCB1]TCX52955.1 prepilin peptidase [Dehalobacter sp. 12DCB1]